MLRRAPHSPQNLLFAAVSCRHAGHCTSEPSLILASLEYSPGRRAINNTWFPRASRGRLLREDAVFLGTFAVVAWSRGLPPVRTPSIGARRDFFRSRGGGSPVSKRVV